MPLTTGGSAGIIFTVSLSIGLTTFRTSLDKIGAISFEVGANILEKISIVTQSLRLC